MKLQEENECLKAKIIYLEGQLTGMKEATRSRFIVDMGKELKKSQKIPNRIRKQAKLKINFTNKNDIIKLIGPPSTKSTFDNDVFIYIERKTSSSKLSKLGKKKLLTNNVLVLEIDNTGLLLSK